MLNNMLVRVALVVMCAAILGCAGTKQLYPGTERPASEVGTVTIVVDGAITKIGGRELAGQGVAFSLLPSTYVVEFRVAVPVEEFLRVSMGNDGPADDPCGFWPGKGCLRNVKALCSAVIDVKAAHVYQLTRGRPETLHEGEPSRLSDDGAGAVPGDIDVFVSEVGRHGNVVGFQLADCESQELIFY